MNIIEGEFAEMQIPFFIMNFLIQVYFPNKYTYFFCNLDRLKVSV